MQRHRILLASAALAALPLGCQTMSDVFNEPPADTQRTERAEDADEDVAERDRDEEARRDARRQRTAERRDDREEARREARREAREDARERVRSRARQHIPASSCPMRVEGARVTMVDVTDGIALEFTAERDRDIEQIRDRARRLMDTRRSVSSMRDIDDPDLEALPQARVDYDIQPDGARIEFKVDSPTELRELRTQLRERIDVMRDEENCPRDMMTMLERGSGRAG